MTTEPEDAGFYVASIYGMATKQALVSVKLKDVAVQVTPEKAREFAHMLFEAAEAAEGDGFVLEYMRGLAGGETDPDKLAAGMLREFRKFRERTRLWHRAHYDEQ